MPAAMPAAVVVPTLREAATIARVVGRVRDTLPGSVVWVVDDDSDDGTADLAEAAGARVLRRDGPRGLGHAYRAAFAAALAAGFDPIYQMDADLSHDPADLRRLDGAPLVIGLRWVDGGGISGWSRRRQLLSRLGSLYARAWLRIPVRDLTGGFKRWDAALLERVLPCATRAQGYAFQVETTLRAWELGAKILEVPIVFTERASGASKMTAAIAWEAAATVPRMRR